MPTQGMRGFLVEELRIHYSVYTIETSGGDMASTQVAKPEVHAEETVNLVKKAVP